MNESEAKTAADILRRTEAAKPADAIDRALKEAARGQQEMSFESFVQSLKLTWPKTRLCQVAVVLMTALMVYLLATGKGELAALVFSVILWILGVQKEQRVVLGLVFGATQHMVRQAAQSQTATVQQGHALAQIGEQVDQLKAGVDDIRVNTIQGGTTPSPTDPPA